LYLSAKIQNSGRCGKIFRENVEIFFGKIWENFSGKCENGKGRAAII
jgi:hypothetical protein